MAQRAQRVVNLPEPELMEIGVPVLKMNKLCYNHRGASCVEPGLA